MWGKITSYGEEIIRTGYLMLLLGGFAFLVLFIASPGIQEQTVVPVANLLRGSPRISPSYLEAGVTVEPVKLKTGERGKGSSRLSMHTVGRERGGNHRRDTVLYLCVLLSA